MKTNNTRFIITANNQFRCGLPHTNFSNQYHNVYAIDSVINNLSDHIFLCKTAHIRKSDAQTHTPPLIIISKEFGCAANSFNASHHASAVHTRKIFHTNMNNTNASSRVTRKGGLLIYFLPFFRFGHQPHEVFISQGVECHQIRRKLVVIRREGKQPNICKDYPHSAVAQV